MTMSLTAQCCIAGGGPAGLMLGLMLARAGLDVVVLEKHADFLRDFRGDTLHPSTLEVMRELGLLDGLLDLPHQRVETVEAEIGGRRLRVADFRHLPVACPFIALMPQWDFLTYLAEAAGQMPGFRLLMRTEATALVEEAGRVAGVAALGPDGPQEVRADLTVAADGRGSVLRDASGLAVEAFGVPMDVQWFHLARPDPGLPLATMAPGALLVLLPRGDYWQCGHVIPKGGDAALRAGSLAGFRTRIAAIRPELAGPLDALTDWSAVKLLTVKIDRLNRWCREGLLCIGDAAHAMSPVGGVGINLAIQDAVAAANLLAGPLARGRPALDALAQVERRRLWPTRATQALQLAVQRRVISEALTARGTLRVPLAVRLLDAVPPLRRLPARLIGMGLRPEHVAAGLRAAAGHDRPPR